MSTCKRCTREIVNVEGRWIDPEATGDDSVWRETCDDNHDTFAAEHEPDDGPVCEDCGDSVTPDEVTESLASSERRILCYGHTP